jgi:cobalt-zinc-cadmium resistance protein CzcA
LLYRMAYRRDEEEEVNAVPAVQATQS